MKSFADFGIDLKGKTGVEVKTTCPRCSPGRKKSQYPCLSVNTEKGVWHCWHCGWKGGLVSSVKTYPKPKPKPLPLSAEQLAWFERRKITRDVLERNGVFSANVFFPQAGKSMDCIAFPYRRGNEIVNVKYRTIEDKYFRQESGCERVLYGLDDIGHVTIVCEGEMDKLAFEVAGYRCCVSVPDGAPPLGTKLFSAKFEWLESCAEHLARVDTFILACDGDEPGQLLEAELARRLGKDRCRRVVWPEGCKDANDVLMKYGAVALAELVVNSKAYPIEGLHEPEELVEDVLSLYRTGLRPGVDTGILGDLYLPRQGEWTLVTGIPGHGKSELLDQIMVNLAKMHGWSFAVFSPENQPLERHVAKLAEKVTGRPFSGPNRMTEGELEQALKWVHKHFLFILPHDDMRLDTILGLARVAIRRRGVTGVVIDPWNEIEHARPAMMSETEYISQSLSEIRRFCRAHSVHAWLVAHPAKMRKDDDGGYPVPTPYDVSGSAHWRNKADNCLAVHRPDFLNPHGLVEVHVQKVRFRECGRAGVAELRYNRENGCYERCA